MGFFTDVLGGLTGIGAGLSGFGGLLGSIFSNNSANKQLKVQQQENQLNRDFNAEQARLNREFQVQMMDKENDYNDPTNVVSRLQRAGINPAVAFGQIAPSASAASGSSASFSGGVGTALPDWSGLSSPGNSLLQREMVQAQTRLINSEAAKNEKELPYVERAQEMSLRMFDSQSWMYKSIQNLNDRQAEQVYKSLELLDKQIANMDWQNAISEESWKQSVSQTNIKAMESRYAASYYCGQARQLHGFADLSEAQIMKIGATLMHEIALMDASARQANSTSDSLDLDNALKKAVQECQGLGVLSEAEVRRILANTENAVKLQENLEKDRENRVDVAMIGMYSEGLSGLFNVGEMMYNNRAQNNRELRRSDSIVDRYRRRSGL